MSSKLAGSEPVSTATEHTIVPTHDSVIFLVFKINRDSMTGKSTVQLTGRQKTAGRMKSLSRTYPEAIVVELYEQNALISSVSEQHPLFKHMEYEEHGKLTRQLIKLAEAEFFVRLPYTGTPGKIKLSEIIGRSRRTELATIKL